MLKSSSISTYLDTAALFVLLLVVAMRPLLSETYESGLHAIVRAAESPEIATSATTAWFDLAIWSAAVMATVSAALRRARWQWTGAELGWLILLIAAAVSTLSASNRRVAANASADWLTSLAMLFVLANLCRDRRRIALVLAVITASGAASAARCGMQVGTEFAETWAQYNETRSEFWAKQGVPLDDPRVELFERRMKGNEAYGFFPHSNTEAAFLCLASFAGLALSAFFAGSRVGALIFRMLALALFAAILTTGSRGGLVAAVVGGVLWFVLGYVGDTLRRHWRATLAGAAALVIGGALAVAVIGAARGGLPGRSLDFRWQYWKVTREIIAEHQWTGVGALNFDRAYLLYKPIEYPEEINDPHNFVFAILAEWGMSGGIGLLLVIGGLALTIARRSRPRLPGGARFRPADGTYGGWEEGELTATVPEPMSARPAYGRLAALAAGFLVLRLALFRDLLSSGDQGARAMVFFDLGAYGLLWIIIVAITLLAVRRSDGVDIDQYKTACLCGCLAFLLHNTIDFAMFYPGTLTPFVALAAMLLAGRQSAPISAHGAFKAWIGPVIAVGGSICFLAAVFLPVVNSSIFLNFARSKAAKGDHVAIKLYHAAAGADRLDPTPLVELAGLYTQSAEPQNLDHAVKVADQAILRDPGELSLYRLRSRILELRYHANGSQADLLAAIGAARQALSLYPSSPDEYVNLADLLARAARERDSAEFAADAIDCYRKALALDAARPEGEIRRQPAEWRKRIQRQIDELATRPATQTATSNSWEKKR